MNDAIKLWSENYINGDDSITVVSGDGTKAYLYDQKPATVWISSGSNDTTTETIDITFKNWQGSTVNRTFDRIAILGHNLKAITADYHNGSTWVSITEATLTLAVADTIISIGTPITANRIRLNCTAAQTTNAEKYIGELKVCQNLLSFGLMLSDWQPSGEQRAGAYRLSGGSLVSWKEYTKLAGTLTLDNVSLASKDTLLPYIKSGSFVTLAFMDTYDVSEIYEMAIVNAPSIGVDRKAELFTVPLELRER